MSKPVKKVIGVLFILITLLIGWYLTAYYALFAGGSFKGNNFLDNLLNVHHIAIGELVGITLLLSFFIYYETFEHLPKKAAQFYSIMLIALMANFAFMVIQVLLSPLVGRSFGWLASIFALLFLKSQQKVETDCIPCDHDLGLSRSNHLPESGV